MHRLRARGLSCIALVLAVLLLAVAQPLRAAAPPTMEQAMRAALASTADQEIRLWDWARWYESLTPLYAARGYAPLWFSEGRLTRAAAGFLKQLDTVELRGLIAADYEGARLQQLIALATAQGPLSYARLARFDVALSVTAARLASDLHRGRIDPASVGYDLDIAKAPFSAAAAVGVLAEAENPDQALDALEPQLSHYKLLKAALARYLQLARDPSLTQLPALPRKGVQPGEPYEGARELHRLLVALGDLPFGPGAGATYRDEPDAAAVLDDVLVEGLKRFQKRHGLDADGVLGRGTFRALTTPLPARVQQIALSLERVRWLPPRLDSPPIIVNVPQFRLFAFRTTQDLAQDILQMDVIVGSDFKGRQTPVFAADMRFVVLQPYWDVPRSILLKELLPSIQASPHWIEENGYEMVQGPGDDAKPLPATDANVRLLAEGKLRLRQKPGAANALGHVKFMFPNRHNVYLHDTPARALFARTRRAFSHGCIRVADPMGLLAHVLRDQPAWTEERIAAALRGSTPVRIPLTRPIRVFILYGTALATEAGATLFFEDIYQQDGRLTTLLNARRPRLPPIS